MKYDIIGDIHGQAQKLINLLQKLGYKKHNGIYQQVGHQAIYVGDFIDRGPYQKQVIGIVRPMIENDHALAVMGNHEFNAICYHTKHNEKQNEYLRGHNEKNKKQHEAFLEEYSLGDEETDELIGWFKTLPLFLELDAFRVIHACWDQNIITELQKNRLTEDNCLLVSSYADASSEDHLLYNSIETLLKGKELQLPDGMTFKDKDGNERHEIRIKWWADNVKTYQQASVLEIPSLTNSPEIIIDKDKVEIGYPLQDKPVFFGHYWFTGTPKAVAYNVACLDYSAAKEGPLVAYRWGTSDLKKLNNNQFILSD